MNQTITITVAPDGKTKVETHGFTGQSCKDASQFIETALGRKTAEQFKPEYFLDENTNLQHKERIQC
jgi:hypothetical protein